MIESAKTKVRHGFDKTRDTARSGARKLRRGIAKAAHSAKEFLAHIRLNVGNGVSPHAKTSSGQDSSISNDQSSSDEHGIGSSTSEIVRQESPIMYCPHDDQRGNYWIKSALEPESSEKVRSEQQEFESKILTAINRSPSTHGRNAGSSQRERLRDHIQETKDSVTLSILDQFGTSCPSELRKGIRQAIETTAAPVHALLQIHAAFKNAKTFLDKWTRAYPCRPGTEVDGCLVSLAEATSPEFVGLLPSDLRKYLNDVERQIKHERNDSDKYRLSETVVKAFRTLDDYLRKTTQEAIATNRY